MCWKRWSLRRERRSCIPGTTQFLEQSERRSIPYKLFPDTEMKDKLDIPCPIYMSRYEDFDFETDQPWILSLRPSFQLKWSDNNRYEGQDE